MNLVDMFDLERTSWLQWARANDDEVARERLRRQASSGQDSKPAKPAKPTIETFEWSPVVELLAQLFELGQHQIHATHTHQTKAAKKRPKITSYPTPRTAATRAKRSEQQQAFVTVESLITFSDEPYGPESGLVRHSKLSPDVAEQPRSRNEGRRLQPNRLRLPDGTDTR